MTVTSNKRAKEMGEVAMDDYEVVIIGAGICGLATAVALQKKEIKSVVMERSEALRNITGAAIGIRQNGWRALDQLGVADVLRRTGINIKRYVILFFRYLIDKYIVLCRFCFQTLTNFILYIS